VSARLTLPDGVTTVCGGRNVVVTAVETPPPPPPPPPPEMLPIPGKVMFMLIMGTGTIHQKKRKNETRKKRVKIKDVYYNFLFFLASRNSSSLTSPFHLLLKWRNQRRFHLLFSNPIEKKEIKKTR
jgi:hypothetical protein